MPPVSQKPLSPRRFSMLRSYALPDLFTMGNAACGTACILLCLAFLSRGRTNQLWLAIGLLPLAFVLDGVDGWVARKRGRASVIGADMDSLADIISFGVAPAVLGYTVGLDGGWDAVILCAFVVAGLSRLARYNVTAADLAGDDGKVSHFEGTPIPTSLALVLLVAVAVARGDVGARIWLGTVGLGPWELHPLALLYLASGSLMISSIPIPKP
jgi:CDP-diacylglycerol--serine O-phosphatidyltransferase